MNSMGVSIKTFSLKRRHKNKVKPPQTTVWKQLLAVWVTDERSESRLHREPPPIENKEPQ